MEVNELKNFIRDKVTNSPFGYHKSLSPYKEQIIELGGGLPFKEAIYEILNPGCVKTCPVCGKTPTPFQNMTVGYSKTCSRKCAGASGHDAAMQAIKDNQEEVSAKRRETLKERTGYESPLQNPESRAKFVQTSLERYGVEHPTQSEEAKGKERTRCLEQFGVPTWFNTDKARAIASENMSRAHERDQVRQTIERLYGDREFNNTEAGIRKTLARKSGDSSLFGKIREEVEAGKYVVQIAAEYQTTKYMVRRLIEEGGIDYSEPYHCSAFQKEVYDFVASMFPDAILDDREVLQGKEIDILVPSLGIGFECNGMFYHSDKYKAPGYHKDKFIAARDAGVQLIQIDDISFTEKHDLWLDVIKSKLGKADRKINARSCSVVEVKDAKAKEFLEANHLQGHSSSKHRFGLELDGELVALMTFGKPRFNKVHDHELIRFCSLRGTSVRGGFSRLLKHFERTVCVSGETILTYANCMWSDGKVYKMNGFELTGHSDPNYVWFNGKKVISRYQTQKHKLIEAYGDVVESEDSFMRGQMKSFKYYDAGNLVLSKTI